MRNSLLWAIKPAGDGPQSWLFGTMHVRDLRAFGWLDMAKMQIERCEVFATEFEFSELDPAAMAETLQLPEGVTLSSLLPASARKSLERFCQKHLQCSPEVFENRHPMAVSMLLTQNFMAEDAPLSLDETLWATARQLGKTCTGVETFAEQMAIVGKIPLETHAKNLAWTLKNLSRYRKRLKKMALWYQQANIAKMQKAARKDAKGMRRLLLTDRNVIMSQRIVEIARERSLFCAVGAGHLAGQKGLLRLLKKAGFEVRPVSPA